MARHLAWAVSALLLSPATSPAAELCVREQAAPQKPAAPEHQKAATPDPQKTATPDHQPPKKWWIEPSLRTEFGITDQQSAVIEAIWQKSLTRRAETRERLEKAEAALSQMMLDAAVDESIVIAQIDRVEAARTEASKARILMLYRINKVLNPEQRAKLDAKAKAMRDQRDGGRRELSR